MIRSSWCLILKYLKIHDWSDNFILRTCLDEKKNPLIEQWKSYLKHLNVFWPWEISFSQCTNATWITIILMYSNLKNPYSRLSRHWFGYGASLHSLFFPSYNRNSCKILILSQCNFTTTIEVKCIIYLIVFNHRFCFNYSILALARIEQRHLFQWYFKSSVS